MKLPMKSAGLVAHLARFAGALRDAGIDVSLSDEADALTALTLVDLGDREEVRRALVSALKIRPRDAERFDDLFERWWNWRRGAAAKAGPEARRRRAAAEPGNGKPGPLPIKAPDDAPEEGPPASEGGDPGYSPEAVLRRKPFEELKPEELRAMARLVARLAPRLATRPGRRRVPTRGPGEPDLRRSLRRAVATGGEAIDLARRKRAVERPRLVVLTDTSGSMDQHTRFLLTFVLALGRAVRATEVFAFNTALVRITPWLQGASRGGADRTLGQALERTLDRLRATVPDWSGGTRIAECLAEFVARHLDRVVDARTVVLIASDGLDRGDLDSLPSAMRAIHRRAKKVIWLNPLAGDPRYEPTARAMAAALPFVDTLLPAHNLESLERLLPEMAA